MSSGSDVDQISITWNQPFIPNGIIIMYDIRYRESNNSDSFVFSVNGITETQYIISGLTSFISYTIGVRAYTITGPGEWIDIQASTLLPGIYPVYKELLLICYYNTGIKDLIVEILENIVIINWKPLNYTELTSYVLEYKQTNEQTFQTIIFPVSVVSTGSPRLQHDIEYVFQVYGVFTINNVKYESEKSPPVTIMITMDSSSTTTLTPSSTTSSTPSLNSSSNDSQTGSTGLVAGISVLSIIIIILIIIIIIIVVLRFIEKNENNKKEIQKFVKDINN